MLLVTLNWEYSGCCDTCACHSCRKYVCGTTRQVSEARYAELRTTTLSACAAQQTGSTAYAVDCSNLCQTNQTTCTENNMTYGDTVITCPVIAGTVDSPCSWNP